MSAHTTTATPSFLPPPAEQPTLINGDGPVGLPAQWSRAQRFAFRFAFVYFSWDTLPEALNLGSNAIGLSKWGPIWKLTGARTDAFGAAIWRTEVPRYGTIAQIIVHFTGAMIIAAGLATLWSLVDRRRDQYTALHKGLRVYLRYFLAAIMLGYGLLKVIPSQMPGVLPTWLVVPFGQLHRFPMFWSFMGLSLTYEIFCGVAETVGALLVCFRRTTTFGAVLLIAVLSNVVALDFAFDVSAKPTAIICLLVAVFLALPDIPRLIEVFVLGRVTRLTQFPVRGVTPIARRARVAIKFGVIGWLVVDGARSSYRARMNYERPRRSHLYGIYDVESFVRNGSIVPPLLTDTSRWRRVVIPYVSDKGSSWDVQLMDDRIVRYLMQDDSSQHTLALTQIRDDTRKLSASYWHDSPGILTVRLAAGPDSLRLQLRRVNIDSMPVFSLPTGWR